MISQVEPVTPREKRFTSLFIVLLIVSFSPFKPAAQFSPVIFILGLIFYVQIRPNLHLMNYIFFILMYTVLGCFYYFAMPEFSLLNHYLFFLTTSSFLILFYNFGSIITPQLIRRLSTIVLVFTVFQSAYGIVQAVVGASRAGTFDISTGDVVRGTIEPSFTPTGLGGNVMFAILVTTLLLFVFATSKQKLSLQHIAIYMMILLSLILASVLHVIIFAALALAMGVVLIFLFTKKRTIQGKYVLGIIQPKVIIIIIGFVFSLFTILPTNVSNILHNYKIISFTETSRSEKVRATFNTLYHLADDIPLQPLVGLGPGQYSSRASLIRTGEYLTGSSVPLPTYISTATDRYILSLWRNFYVNHPGGGSTYFPFYSWLSLYGELGIVGLGIAALLLLKGVLTLGRFHSSEFPRMNLFMLALLLFVALLGLQDNYWEFTQALFPAVLLLSLCCTYLRKEEQRKRQPISGQGQDRLCHSES